MLTDDNHGQLLAAMDEPRVSAAWDQLAHDLVAGLAPLGLALELEVNLFETHRIHQVHERLFKPLAAAGEEALYVRLRAMLGSDGTLLVVLFAHDSQGFDETAPAVLRAQLFSSGPVPGWRTAPDPVARLAQAWVEAGFGVEAPGWREALREAGARLDAGLRP